MHSYQLSNDALQISVKAKGAELTSIKSLQNDYEYLWQADANYWGKHSPVLFPIIGMLNNNQYTFEGKTYTLSRHGFARDKEFMLTGQTENSLSFTLESDADTLAVYPFPFTLIIHYTLEGNKLNVGYEIKNTSNKTMWFSIGAHPAFNYPLPCTDSREDCYLEFEKEESINRLVQVDGILTRKTAPFLDNSNTLRPDKGVLPETFIVKGLQSNYMAIKSTKNTHAVGIYFEGFPYLGIWSSHSDAPFICLEPWYGITDFEDHAGDLTKKEGIQSLSAGAIFEASYTIEIN